MFQVTEPEILKKVIFKAKIKRSIQEHKALANAKISFSSEQVKGRDNLLI